MMRMGTRALAAAREPHGPGDAEDGPEVHLAFHRDRQDGEALFGGPGMERGIRLDDEL
jgi:hypothetical protein